MSKTSHQFLNSLINNEKILNDLSSKDFSLDTIHLLLKRLGSPEKKLKVVHIAGSKGKGSISMITAEVLKQQGYKVGLYTSPHFYDYRERIRVCELSSHVQKKSGQGSCIFDDFISEEALDDMVQKVKPVVDDIQQGGDKILTFFEVFTAIALLYFYEQKVDVVILETGLGGRLDATNVCDAMVNVISPISLEHQYILGETIEEIAGEKAAIIKSQDTKVVCSWQPEKALRIIKKRCHDQNVDVLFLQESIDIVEEENRFSLKGFQNPYECLKTNVYGRHQLENIATVIGVCEFLKCLGFDRIVYEKTIQALENIYLPGRFEVIHNDPTIILDGAHNLDSAQCLVHTLHSFLEGCNKEIVFVLGFSKDKDIQGVVDVFQNVAGHFILTQAEHSRAYDFEAGDIDFLENKCVENINDVKDVVVRLKDENFKNKVIVVTGSMFLVGDVRLLIWG